MSGLIGNDTFGLFCVGVFFVLIFFGARWCFVSWQKQQDAMTEEERFEQWADSQW